MTRHDAPNTEDMAQASPSSSIFQSQETDEQIAKQFLQAMKEDLPQGHEFERETIEAVQKMAEQYTNRRQE